MSDTATPATVASGHLVLTPELRERIRERLLHMLDVETERLERDATDPDAAANAQRSTIDASEAVRAALVKLDAGFYGVCERCQEPIPFERLDAIPHARHCVTCQQRPRSLFG